MGKRQISKITPFHLVTYIAIGILAALISANIITDLKVGLVSIGVWILTILGIDYLCIKSKWFYNFVHGKDTILVKGGEIIENNLKHSRLTGDELLSELRKKNVFNLTDVEFAIMEPTGEMNILFKSSKNPNSSRELGNKNEFVENKASADKTFHKSI